MSIPTSTVTNGPNYGPISMSTLSHCAGQQLGPTSGIAAYSGFLVSTDIMIPPPTGDGMYVICGRRNPYQADGTTPCNNNGWFWALVQFRTIGPGSTYMGWIAGSSAWTTWNLGRWYNYAGFQAFETTSTSAQYPLAFNLNGGTDAPFAWTFYMSKFNN